ncbi:MAG: hypothetical protein ACK5SI_00395, partial [Planctomycetia bacterium]
AVVVGQALAAVCGTPHSPVCERRCLARRSFSCTRTIRDPIQGIREPRSPIILPIFMGSIFTKVGGERGEE